MTENFTYTANPARVVFGVGTRAAVADEVRRLGAGRVLLLSSRPLTGDAAAVPGVLGSLLVAQFDGAAMHTPVEVTEQALRVLHEHRADCLVAVGGGSVTGLAKALAVRTDLPQIILPTTYAGSEVTPVLGETADGRKVTRSAPEILPETVVYDVDLTLDLPVEISVCSAVNALAHAVEALYAPDANPIVDQLALDAVARIGRALPRLAADPRDVAVRTDLLRAAWLAGTCLGAVGMGLHHKLCHVLGGTLGLPHAQTHTVVLPHAMAYNASAVPETMERIAAALDGDSAAAAVYDLIVRSGGPTSLRQLGMSDNDIPRVVEQATAMPYPNPRAVTAEGIEQLLRAAWSGTRPSGTVRDGASPAAPDLTWLTDQVVASFSETPNPRLRHLLSDLVRHAHHYVSANDVTQQEWQYAIDFLTRTGQKCDDKRQEFVLLSDTLGISSAVDVLTNSRTPDTTASAVLGPFYVPGPPEREQGSDISGGLPGTPLWVDVRVTDVGGDPVADAMVDVWQANQDGFYDLQLPDLDGPVLRARFRTDGQGRLRFWTILPSAYPIPVDGPVGEMIEATGRHPWRAPHLHFLIAEPGFRQLITQLFVAGGPYLSSEDTAAGRGDTVFGVKSELVVEFPVAEGVPPEGKTLENGWRRLDFTFHITEL
ncbi:maleylacetate reductase and hydroxyquinol 1,2-dioxygenase domain-containing protein [Nocardia alni]|uniref:maleylacetate reductase and hydroxyquinol 1,2-dioxygenase domain-containing protein n=1 Tax=Nocardia alni TaxID=2815723 RepID=UPI0027DFD4EF|nr:maleylacetate reductase and hydroxyquinol 1,2-dioxygenase domain-containing protein [Nocardia alni]